MGQGYSAIGGFFRQYTFPYIASDEREVIRLRTNYRKNEEVYLFRTTAKPPLARAIFLDYLERANSLPGVPNGTTRADQQLHYQHRAFCCRGPRYARAS